MNVIIGALMLKEFNQLTDDELMDSILCDVRYQYALHTTSFEEQPVSDRTFSRFRERLYEYERTGMIRAQFQKDLCEKCPHRDRCKGKPQRKTYAVHVSAKMVHRARLIRKMSTEEYRVLSRKRNAVEGVMSVLRRHYGIDEIPVFGHKRSKMFFTFKVGAYNLGKFFRYCQRVRGSIAPIQAFA